MNIFCCCSWFPSTNELIDSRKPSRREGTKIAQGKRSAALGRQANPDAPPCRGGTITGYGPIPNSCDCPGANKPAGEKLA